MKKVIVFLLAAVSIFCFAGCNDNAQQTTTAYGEGYNGHIIRAEVSLNKDNTIKSLYLDEFLPINEIGRLDRSASTEKVDAAHQEGGYAKWVRVGDKVFTLLEGSTYTNPSYPENNDAFRDFYVNEVEKGNFWICRNSEGDKYNEIDFSEYRGNPVAKNNWTSKRDNGYSMAGSTMSIKGNFQKIESAAKGKSLSSALSSDETGATLAAHDDYMAVAVRAYNKAIND